MAVDLSRHAAYRGPVKFVLSASGHIAGVVNPPGGKYGHWENDKNPPTSEEWFATATAYPDSWWPMWERSVSQYAGGEVPARRPGEGKLKPVKPLPAPTSRSAPPIDGSENCGRRIGSRSKNPLQSLHSAREISLE